ncbi:MAG: hypothetical protein RL701_6946 [Pseudomonadota bacterium]
MTFSLLWLPEVLGAAGLKVALVRGWEQRGRREFGQTLGVLCHHTAGPGKHKGNMPTLRMLVEGRPNLRGPLAQLGLGRDGTYYVVAAGVANHAGDGSALGITNGNDHFIGIEAENTGHADDPWPEVQLDAYRRGCAAILQHVGLRAEHCVGHKEYAPTRKSDPSFDMGEFRRGVALILDGAAPVPVLIPRAEPGRPSGGAGRPTLRRSSRDHAVAQLCSVLGLPPHELFDVTVEVTVREFQRRHQLVPDGIVGPKTWAALDAIASSAHVLAGE